MTQRGRSDINEWEEKDELTRFGPLPSDAAAESSYHYGMTTLFILLFCFAK